MTNTPPDTLFARTVVQFLYEIADCHAVLVMFEFEIDASAMKAKFSYDEFSVIASFQMLEWRRRSTTLTYSCTDSAECPLDPV